MSQLSICRICLCKDAKMYKYNQYQLKYYYEQIMAIKVNEHDSLPQCFCYECAAMLYKFHKFKEKCYRGQIALKETLRKRPLTYITVNKIDRQSKNLQTHFGIVTVSNRVKTFIIKNRPLKPKHKIKLKPQNMDIASIDINSDSESVKIDYFNANSDNDIEIETKDCESWPANSQKMVIDTETIINDDTKITIESVKVIDIEHIFPEGKVVIDKLIENKITIDEEKMLEDNIAKGTDKKRKAAKTKECKKRKNNKNSKSKNSRAVGPESNPNKFKTQHRREKFLDSNNWQKFSLTEEEAEKEFRAKAEDPKYLKMPYKCTNCFKGFSKEDMLNRHIKLRHNESAGEICCRYCGMRFKWVCFLRRHMRQHYTKYKCLRCELVCSRETTALFHEEYHNGVIRKCEHCGEEFKHSSTYYTHLRTHRSAHVCALCGASFVSAAGLHRHKLLKHFEPEPEPEPVGPKEIAEVNTYCERCDIKFETCKAYEEHLIHSAMHADGIEDLAEDVPAPSNPKRRKKLYKRKYRKPTTCNKCGEHFDTQKDFIKHHLAVHPRVPIIQPNERHICEICGISLAPVSVASHLNTHTRQHRYTCATCGLQVYSKGSLTRHQLTHSDEKPYPCALCDKRFKQKCSMQLHYRTFHLKQPYPKRNRKKKMSPDEIPLTEYRNEGDSDDNITLDRWR